MAWPLEQANAGLIIIIPAKPFAEAKTRLMSLLSPTQRAELSRHLLKRTIAVAAQICPVVVISQGAEVEQVAVQAGANFLSERQAGLNPALGQAIAWADVQGASQILIIPADLPNLSSTSLQTLIASGERQQPGIVVAPCRRNEGTNALYLSPPNIIQPCFGPNSLRAHRQRARLEGIPATIFQAPDLAFDLDTPQDWQYLAKVNPEFSKIIMATE